MIFSLHHSTNSKSVVINHKNLERVYEAKFLGVYLDPKLSWKNHILYTKRKISKSIGLLSKAKKTLDIHSLITLYYSFTYPYFTYCIELWGNTYKTYMDSLFLLQKRIIRIITSSKRNEHTASLFKKLEILPLSKLFEYRILMMLYKFENKKVPVILQNIFTKQTSVHSYNTRNASSLTMPKLSVEACRRSFIYAAIVIYNNAKKVISFTMNVHSFKKQLKSSLSCNNSFLL